MRGEKTAGRTYHGLDRSFILDEVRALFTVVMLAGCFPADRDRVPPPAPLDLPSAGDATLKPGTIVLSDSAMYGAVVLGDHIVFPIEAPIDLAKGDVIVSGAGDGFIRRVVLVEAVGDTLRVFTSKATLADAVDSAHFHATLFESFALDETFEGTTEWLTTHVDASLAVDPTLDIQFAVTDGAFERFDLRITGKGTTSLDGDVAFTSPYHWQWGDEKRDERTLFRRAFALGPLPIVVSGRLSTSFDANAAVDHAVTLQAGTAADFALDAHAQLSRVTGWSTRDASTFDVTRIDPTHGGDGSAALAIGIFPRLELSLFGVSEADIDLGVQAGTVATMCNAGLLTGQQALLQGNGRFRLQSLTNTQETTLTLWDQRMGELAQCAAP